MAGPGPTDAAALLRRIDESWLRLARIDERLSAAGRLELPLDDGWTAKQHLAHVSAWERSLQALLRGTSRTEAMGVPPALHAEHGLDAVNDYIARTAGRQPTVRVLLDFVTCHVELRATLEAMPPGAFDLPYSHYQPDDPPFNPAPVVRWVAGNTWQHYDEHAAMLERRA